MKALPSTQLSTLLSVFAYPPFLLSPMFEVLVRRQQRILFPEPALTDIAPNYLVRGFLLDIALLGYTLDATATEVLARLARFQLTHLHKKLVDVLQYQVGARGNYTPLFLNFPFDVPDQQDYLISRVDAYLNHTLGVAEGKALSCGHVVDPVSFNLNSFGACPICQHQVDGPHYLPTNGKRTPLKEKTPLRVLRVGGEHDALQLLRGLVQAKTSLSEQDQQDVQKLIALVGEDVNQYTENITFKETLALVAVTVYYLHRPAALQGGIDASIHTVTDVLRIAVAFSDGDVSLATPTRFKRFSRGERRYLLARIEKVLEKDSSRLAPEEIGEDFYRWTERWKRLGAALHAGDYKNQFPLAATYLRQLTRKDARVLGFNSQVETLLSVGRYPEAIQLLSTRPGELARRLDQLARVDEITFELTKQAFQRVANQLPTPLLLQLLAHFRYRSKRAFRGVDRYFFPKGSLAKLFVLPDTRANLNAYQAVKLQNTAYLALFERFSALPKLGTVVVEQQLKDYLVPQSQRSASTSLLQLTRGSRVSLPKTPIIRAFMHWQEPEGNRTDLDLSAVFYNPEWEVVGVVSYYDLAGYGCASSGDIQSAPNGAAEYIDLNREALLKANVHYVALSVISYNSVPFNHLPEAFAGVMGRQDAAGGQVFEARTVQDRFDLQSECTSVVPYVIDLVFDQLIWCDLALSGGGGYQNVGRQSKQIAQRVQAILHLGVSRPTLYDLFHLHQAAREEPRSEELTIFGVHEGIKPTDTEKILGNFLQ